MVKGLGQTLRALEAGNLKAVFLADDCDNSDFKDVVLALAKEKNVPVINVESWVELKDACKLGLDSEKIKELSEAKGKDIKIKPKCSVAGVTTWDEASEAVKFLKDQ